MTKNKYIESKYFLITDKEDIGYDNKEKEFKVINIDETYKLSLAYSQMKLVEGGLEIRIKLGTRENPDEKSYMVYNSETKEKIEVSAEGLCNDLSKKFVEVAKTNYDKFSL